MNRLGICRCRYPKILAELSASVGGPLRDVQMPQPLDDELVKELYVKYKTLRYVLRNNDCNDSHKGTIHVWAT